MNKLPIRLTHVLCSFSIRFVYVQRKAFSDCLIFDFSVCQRTGYIFIRVGISWLKRSSMTEP